MGKKATVSKAASGALFRYKSDQAQACIFPAKKFACQTLLVKSSELQGPKTKNVTISSLYKVLNVK